MPSKSKKQAKMMSAVAHNPKFAKKVGIPQEVGKEFHNADVRKGKYFKKKVSESAGEMKAREVTNTDPYWLGYSHYHRELYDKPHPRNPHQRGTPEFQQWEYQYAQGVEDRTRERSESVVRREKLLKEKFKGTFKNYLIETCSCEEENEEGTARERLSAHMKKQQEKKKPWPTIPTPAERRAQQSRWQEEDDTMSLRDEQEHNVRPSQKEENEESPVGGVYDAIKALLRKNPQYADEIDSAINRGEAEQKFMAILSHHGFDKMYSKDVLLDVVEDLVFRFVQPRINTTA